MPAMADQKYLSSNQVRRRYGDPSPRTLHRWIARGRIPAPDIILPNGRKAWAEQTLEEHERASVVARD
jgi:hypothetical protein